MVEAAFEKMAYDNPDLDFVLVPGDLIGHGISLDYDKRLQPVQEQKRYT